MVRLVGRIKKEEEGGIGAAGFYIQILSIQEADWADVKRTRGAVVTTVVEKGGFSERRRLGEDDETGGKD
jgi:hypothetical protein